MTTPTPLFMPARRTEKTARPVQITADLIEDAPAQLTGPGLVEITGLVRPGLVDEVTVSKHDGIIKAKNLKPGQVVRAYLHGAPRGGERVVDTVERSEDGGTVHVTFSSQHPANDYKAAYRFYVEALVGTDVTTTHKVHALVPYQEV